MKYNDQIVETQREKTVSKIQVTYAGTKKHVRSQVTRPEWPEKGLHQ